MRPPRRLASLTVAALLAILGRLSPAMRQRLAHATASAVLACARSTRLRLLDNVRQAFPRLDEDEVRRIGCRSYQTIYAGVLDTFWLNDLRLDIDCDDNARRTLVGEHGAIAITLHTCCYEAASLAVQRLTGRSTTLSYVPTYLTQGFDFYRNAGIEWIHKKAPGAFFSLVDAARRGRFVTLHGDHHANDVGVHFFERPTGAPCGGPMLSALAGRPLLLAYAQCVDAGHYRVCFETLSAQPVARDRHALARTTQHLYARFEQIIRERPEEWYWSYKRWRPRETPKRTSASPPARSKTAAPTSCDGTGG
ncbi:MAG: lysophospholipid acyltransferase family protein [Rhodocyclaceae bacterium]